MEEVGGKDFKKHVKLNSCFLISLLHCTVIFVANVDGYQLKSGIKQR